MPKQPVENIELYYPQDGDASLSCTYAGARYHVWLCKQDVADWKPGVPLDFDHVRITHGEAGKELYQNPMDRNLRPSDKGYFRTRHMRLDGPVGRVVVPAMLAKLPELLEPAKQRLEAAKVLAAQEHKDAVRKAAIHREAEELYTLVKQAVALKLPSPNSPWSRKADEIINRIESA